MTRRYGRSPRSDRLVEAVPAGHWKTTTLLGALRVGSVPTAMVIDAPTNTEIFRAFIEQCLLRQLQPGDIVVMDNLAVHKAQGIVDIIESAGAQVRYLPAYSPDLNPIEKLWSKVKALLRKSKARDTPGLWKAIGQALDQVTPQDCQGFFRSCGYA